MEDQTVTLQAGASILPSEVRQTLGLEERSQLTMSVRDGGIFFFREPEPASAEVAEEALQRIRQGFSTTVDSRDYLQELRQEMEERLERFCA